MDGTSLKNSVGINNKNKDFYESMLLGLPSALEKLEGIDDIYIDNRSGVDEKRLADWERANGCRLPSDLYGFYSSTDGFLMTWSYKHPEPVQLGRIAVNCLEDLKRLGLPEELEPLESEDSPSGKDKIFKLDFTKDGCYICLVFIDGKSSIWLLDKSLEWHKLSDSFSRYFRSMLIHQGVPQWHLNLTNLGMTPWAEHLAYTLAHHLFLESEPPAPQEDWLPECWNVEHNEIDEIESSSAEEFKEAKETIEEGLESSLDSHTNEQGDTKHESEDYQEISEDATESSSLSDPSDDYLNILECLELAKNINKE